MSLKTAKRERKSGERKGKRANDIKKGKRINAVLPWEIRIPWEK